MAPLALLAAVVCALVLGGPQLRQMAADASEAIGPREPEFTQPAMQPTGSLVELAIDNGADVPPYVRAYFGARWADVDRNGCDQRNDTLAAHLVDVQYRAGTRDCVVEAGTFTDLYTGQTRPFVKSDSGGGVDIDHVVPLEAAWRSGAWAWTDEQRLAYANDLTLLVPTDSSLNRSKGSQDPSSWLPPADGGYVCTYLERWVEVKTRYALTVTSDELAAITRETAACPA